MGAFGVLGGDLGGQKGGFGVLGGPGGGDFGVMVGISGGREGILGCWRGSWIWDVWGDPPKSR